MSHTSKLDTPLPRNTMIEGLPNKTYHEQPELSCSQIKTILKNPHEYVAKIKREPTPSMNFGSLGHTLILEPHKLFDEFAIMPNVDGRTKEGKAAKAEFEAASEGKAVMTAQEYETAQLCAESVMKNAGGFFSAGLAEVSYFSEIDEIPVRVRLDYHIKEIGLICDLKFVEDASPDGFAKAIANYGYYIQAAFYLDVTKSKRFVFIAVEKKPPFMVGIYELDITGMEFGRSEYRRAFGLYQRLDEFQTPVYRDGKEGGSTVQTLALPNYVFYKNGASL
jgi:hypothetical protein